MDNKKPSIKKTAIYVDIEDDLTSIIEKVRNSSGEIIALVPPKRIGILQSAVNLKLLQKAAAAKHKKIVIITPDQALGVLASGAGIPVAKNLHSQPELLDVPDDEDISEIIEGQDVLIDSGPTSGRAGRRGEPGDSGDKTISAAVKAISDDDKIDTEAPVADKPPKKVKPKVPNFTKFRKLLIIGIVAGVGLVALLVWLIFFATSATITITAKTSEVKIDQPVNLTLDGASDAAKNQLKLIPVEPVKKTNKIEFEATGSKEIGEKARGSVTLHNADLVQSIPLAAGSYLSINGLQYTLDAAVTIPSVSGSVSSPIAGTVVAQVTAAAMGPEYNAASGTNMALPGYGLSQVYATIDSGGIGGGSKETIKVVQQSDVDKITESLRSDKDSSNVKNELTSKFGDDLIALPDSFKVDFSGVNSSPAVGEKAERATATIEITYSMLGLNKNDLNGNLLSVATGKMSDRDTQMVFDDGFSGVQILSYNMVDGGAMARLVTNAKVGPKLDEDKIREQAVGKKSHEIISQVEKIAGVDDVKIDFFPFWVSTAPEADKIKIVKNGL
ncbi:MAG: hypothetical protein LBC95_02960 [Candidatus Nomurabacteria bacterium]|jgi:hypothetical protein|nr:hypothetical protein [Candidatus Nomurabacteria bacterium]